MEVMLGERARRRTWQTGEREEKDGDMIARRKDRRDAERQGEKKDGEVMYSSLQKRQEGCRETEGSERGWPWLGGRTVPDRESRSALCNTPISGTFFLTSGVWPRFTDET